MLFKWKRTEAPTGFDRSTPEERIAEFVEAIRASPERRQELVPLLREGHPLYHGRGTQACIRLRGYILAAFETTGLPAGALIFALEDLYNTRYAYLIAAAAKAIRGMENPHPEVVPYLLEAVVNIRLMDDAVSFESYKPSWPVQQPTSGLREVFKTFAWLGAYAREALPQLQTYAREDSGFQMEVIQEVRKAIVAIEADTREVDLSCCGPSPKSAGRKAIQRGKSSLNSRLRNILLEDQDGNKESFASFFLGKPTVVSFFYTRCTSINKCSLTVGNNGVLAKSLKDMGLGDKVNVALISYDPVFDLPARIKVFAENRRCEFSESFKAFRVSPDDFELLKAYFELEVGYSTSIVNQHQVETYLLDHKARIRHTLVRIQWSIDEIKDKVTQLVAEVPRNPGKRIASGVFGNAFAAIFPFLIAIFPKCPMCWASYMSAFGIAGMKDLPYSPWLLPLFALGVGVNLWLLYRSRNRRNGMFPFWTSSLGAAILLIAGVWLNHRTGLHIGIVLILLGSILNTLPFSTFQRLQGWVDGLVGRLVPRRG